MKSVATTVRGGALTNEVAGKVLEVSSTVVQQMSEATRSGQTAAILAATVEVYRGVTKYLNSDTKQNNNVNKLKDSLKSRAGEFCDSLTKNSAPDADPVGSASSELLFSCQKVAPRQDDAALTADKKQACPL